MMGMISNEILFFLIFAVNLGFVLAATRLGKGYLFALVVANLLFTAVFGGKLFDAFGVMLSVSLFSYATIFILADILNEHYGKKEAQKAIWIGAFALLAFIVFQIFALVLMPHTTGVFTHNAMAMVFSTTPRLLLASFVSYLVAHHLNIWLYDFLTARFGKNRLWLRNNVSTMVAQFFDCFVFFSIAFLGVLPNEALLQLIVITLLAKIVLAVLDTPVLYASARLVRK